MTDVSPKLICAYLIDTQNITEKKSMTKPITIKNKKDEIYDAYLLASEELEQLKKQLKPKPSLPDITKKISYQLQDEVLANSLRHIAMLICSYLVYLYVMGETTRVKANTISDSMRRELNNKINTIPQLKEIIYGSHY